MKIHYNNGNQGKEKLISGVIAIQVIGANEPITVLMANGGELTISLNNIEMILDESITSDKEIPKQVTHEATIYDALTCPRCKNVVSKREKWGSSNVRIMYQYCPFCGQHLKEEDE